MDELKVDRSFIMAMTTDQSAAVVVRSIVKLAHNLGLSVVAEGVESQAAFDALRELGCDVVQGYLLGRPMGAEDVLVWIAETPWGRAATAPGAHTKSAAADRGRCGLVIRGCTLASYQVLIAVLRLSARCHR